MDLTEYKQAWKNQPDEKNKVSALEIYKMTQAKSTSILKWIFIIAVVEFAFWFGVNFIAGENGIFEPYKKLGLLTTLDAFGYLHYVVIILFIVLFYKNYSSISVIDDTKTLVHKILRTRKTVKWYVYYNLIMIVITSIIMNVLIFNTPDGIETIYKIKDLNIDKSQLMIIAAVSQVIMIIIFILIMWLFYYLLYGILLKKLNRNYKELMKLEDE